MHTLINHIDLIAHVFPELMDFYTRNQPGTIVPGSSTRCNPIVRWENGIGIQAIGAVIMSMHMMNFKIV